MKHFLHYHYTISLDTFVLYMYLLQIIWVYWQVVLTVNLFWHGKGPCLEHLVVAEECLLYWTSLHTLPVLPYAAAKICFWCYFKLCWYYFGTYDKFRSLTDCLVLQEKKAQGWRLWNETVIASLQLQPRLLPRRRWTSCKPVRSWLLVSEVPYCSHAMSGLWSWFVIHKNIV